MSNDDVAMEDAVDAQSQSQSQSQSQYEAPLGPQPHDQIFPGQYIVTLVKGHTLADHQTAMGRDLTPFIKTTYKLLLPQVVYAIHDVDDELLQAIRRDPGCERVDHNLKGQAI